MGYLFEQGQIALEFLNKDFFIALLDIFIFTGFGG